MMKPLTPSDFQAQKQKRHQVLPRARRRLQQRLRPPRQHELRRRHVGFDRDRDDGDRQGGAAAAGCQDLGMNRILVNNVHPPGCTPFRTRPNNYTHCDDVANAVAAAHNKLLAEKLGNYRGKVMLLDLNTALMVSTHLYPIYKKNTIQLL